MQKNVIKVYKKRIIEPKSIGIQNNGFSPKLQPITHHA